MRNALLMSACLLWPGGCHVLAQEGMLTLVQEGEPRCVICVPVELDGPAAELQTYLKKMSGADVPIQRPGEPAEGPVVWLGAGEPPALSGPDLDELELGLDGFAIRSAGQILQLAGSTPQGTTNAVHTFLDKLGCRWYIPGDIGEVVPKRSTISVEPLDEIGKPSYLTRQVWFSLGGRGLTPEYREEWGKWCRRNLFGGVPLHVGHNFHRIAPTADYFEQHPEYFALRNGERDPGGQLCTTNADVIELAVERARGHFDNDPGQIMYSLSPDDHARFCHCDQCDALDPPEFRGTDKGKGRRLLVFANAVAEKLQETHPGKNVAFYAYWGAVEAPTDVQAHPNVIVFFTPIGMAFNYALNDERSPTNKQHDEWFRQWRAVSQQMGIRHYYNFSSILWIPYRQLAEELRYQHESGAKYLNAELWSHAEGSYLTWYLVGKILWDVDVDVEALFDRYMTEFYGPAAEPMKQYYTGLARRWSDCGKEILWPNSLQKQGVFLDVLRELESWPYDRDALLEAAKLARNDDIVKQRIDISRRFLDYMWAWRRYAEVQLDVEGVPKDLSTRVSRANSLVQAVAALAEYAPGAMPEIERILLPAARNLARLGGPGVMLWPAVPFARDERPTSPPTRFRGTSCHYIIAMQNEQLSLTLNRHQIGAYEGDVKCTVITRRGTLETVAEATVTAEEGTKQVALPEPEQKIRMYTVLLEAGPNAASFDTPCQYWCADAAPEASLNIIAHARPVFFFVPKGAEQFRILFQTDAPAETVQAEVVAPSGDVVEDQFVRGKAEITVTVPEGADGKPWSLRLGKAAEGVFEDVSGVHFSDNIPPYISDAPGRLLVPRQ